MLEQFLAILRRALLLEEGAWLELRDNASFTAICAGLAVVVVFLGGLGAWLWGEINFDSSPDRWFLETMILGTIFTLILLVAWLAVIYFVLVYVFSMTVAIDALLRVFAVAIVPLALGFLVFIPELNLWIGFSSIALTFCLLVFALRTAFAVEHMRAMVAVMAGFAVFAIVLALLITYENSWLNGAMIFEQGEDVLTN